MKFILPFIFLLWISIAFFAGKTFFIAKQPSHIQPISEYIDEGALTGLNEWSTSEMTAKTMDSSNIFFIETNESKDTFGPKSLCAFESASLRNPHHNIYVVMSSASNISTIPDYYKPLRNVFFVKLDFDSLFEGTPMSPLWESDAVRKSKYALNNISNSLRMILLHKFGGTYLDNDIISLEAVPEDPTDFIVAESREKVNNAVLKFSNGHSFLWDALARMVF